MDKRVILAVAGSGKTYNLCSNINPEKRNLILAYTNQNIKNIRSELYSKYGMIPEKTKIYTFHSFIYNFFIRPYEPIISNYFSKKILSKGVSVKEPQPQFINRKPNPKYIKEKDYRHYYIYDKIYCSRMSELIVKVKKSKDYNLFTNAINNINKFFENIYIDEFQDFREYDYELLEKIIKKSNNIFLVGDYYQNSVNARNNSGKPFKDSKGEVDYSNYILKLKNQNLIVNTSDLIYSRRCSSNICDFVTEKLGIIIKSANINEGSVLFCTEINEINEILKNDSIIKLLVSNSNKYCFKSLNWGYSKGDTFDNVCVILTSDFENLGLQNFDCSNLSKITINKLYVAMSRSKGNLFIIKKTDFDIVKDNYLIS